MCCLFYSLYLLRSILALASFPSGDCPRMVGFLILWWLILLSITLGCLLARSHWTFTPITWVWPIVYQFRGLQLLTIPPFHGAPPAASWPGPASDCFLLIKTPPYPSLHTKLYHLKAYFVFAAVINE